MPAEPEKTPAGRPKNRHDDEIERPGTAISTDTTETETAHDVEKGLSRHNESSPDVPIQLAGPEPVPGAALDRSASRASSARSRAVTVVQRSKRRGLFGRFTVVPEVERPYEYKNSTKWGITAIIAIAACAAPLGSGIFYPALRGLSEEFHTSSAVTNMSVALYMLAMAIFPLWWSSFSEEFGRRTIYLISFILFIIFSVVCALSINMPMLIVFRCLTGGASASVQAVGAGTLSDIWEPVERGRAMGMFYLGPLLGPILAPLVGGALSESLGWKSCMYFLAIYGLVVWVMVFLFLPETLAKRAVDIPAPAMQSLQRMSTRESAKVQTKHAAKKTKRFLIDPLHVLLMLRFPPVLITVLVAAIAFGALFISNISIQHEFSASPYNYSQIIVGVLYLPPGVGYFLASFFGGKWLDNIMAREARKANRYDEDGKLIYLPEDRMRENMWLANTMYPAGLLLFGWTLNYGIFWFVPSIGAFFFGIASMLVFSTATTMLTEFVRKKSSAGVAVNNFVRNILSCVGTIVAAPWIDAIGIGYVMTIVGLFCLVFGHLGIWLLRRNAQKWRKEMDAKLDTI